MTSDDSQLPSVTLTVVVAVTVTELPPRQVFVMPVPETLTLQPELGSSETVEAVMVAVPIETPVTNPPGEVTVAIVGSELDQVVLSVLILLWFPSEYMPYAASWLVPLVAIVGEGGVMYIELRVGPLKKLPLQPDRNVATHRATAAVSTRRPRSPIGRRPLPPDADSPWLLLKELTVPQN